MPTNSKDRQSLCLFSFADARRCRIPRNPEHPHLCTFHARKESQAQAAQKTGRALSTYFTGYYVSACDLSGALGRLFAATAQGKIKPKTANTLAYLGQTLLQSIPLAQHEYIQAYGTDSWRQTIRDNFNPPAPELPNHNAEAQINHGEPRLAPLPATAAGYVESTLAKLHQNK